MGLSKKSNWSRAGDRRKEGKNGRERERERGGAGRGGRFVEQETGSRFTDSKSLPIPSTSHVKPQEK